MAECNHEWGKWASESVLYSRTARLDGGEIRVCELCGIAEFRNFKASQRPAAITPVVSLYGYCFDQEGRIGIRRRPLSEKNNPGELELPGGSTRAERVAKAKDERIIGEELRILIRERTGLEVEVEPMPPMYPAVLGGGGDWAFGLPVKLVSVGSSGELYYVGPMDLDKLGDGPVGNRILSGKGKRMYQLILAGLANFSPNTVYRALARLQLPQRYF